MAENSGLALHRRQREAAQAKALDLYQGWHLPKAAAARQPFAPRSIPTPFRNRICTRIS